MLQPRITPTLPAEHEARSSSGSSPGRPAIDPYASAVSDVYQDLFGEGSFTGKGIYDVDAFEAAMADRVPENTLLSHDLFEGIFARAGLVTDVELFDEFPSNYLVAAAPPAPLGARRLAAPALDPRPGPGRHRRPARRGSIPGSPAGRWSTTCAGRCPRRSTLATLVAAWTLPSVSAVLWTGVRPRRDDRVRRRCRC